MASLKAKHSTRASPPPLSDRSEVMNFLTETRFNTYKESGQARLVELLCSPFPLKHSMNIKKQDNSKIFTQVLFFEY